MAASLRKMGVYLGLVEDEDGYREPDAYERDPAPAREHAPSSREYGAPAGEYDQSRQRGRVESHARVPQSAVVAREYVAEDTYAAEYVEFDQPTPYRITTLHPRTYNEAVTIGEHFRSGTPVIMNLTEMADSDAKRLVDFAAGLTFGLHGRVERVTAKVFLLSPQNVTVTAQDKARIAENGFFNQS
ncbi:MAG: sepF2 [Pseudonocardiales bacterium]|nr:sepF2 [Pseudonocardiales bacterium]